MDPKKAENNNNSVQSSNILAFLISSPEITLAQELEFGLPTYTCTNSQGLCKIQRLYSPEEALIWPNEKRLVFLQFSILSISKTIKVVEDDMLGDTKGKGNCHFFITTAHPGSQIIEVEPSTFLSFSSVCVCGGGTTENKTLLYIILDLQLSRFAATVCLSTSCPETLALNWPFNALGHSSRLLLWQYRAVDSTASLNPAIEDKQVRTLSEKLLLPSSC